MCDNSWKDGSSMSDTFDAFSLPTLPIFCLCSFLSGTSMSKQNHSSLPKGNHPNSSKTPSITQKTQSRERSQKPTQKPTQKPIRDENDSNKARSVQSKLDANDMISIDFIKVCVNSFRFSITGISFSQRNFIEYPFILLS